MKIIDDIMATRLLFFIMAFFVGLWTLRIPTIKDQINTDYLGIGLVMATFAIGSIIAMIFANNVIKMSSTRAVLLYTSILQAVLWLPTPFITSLQTFMTFSFIFANLCYGSFEISCNLYASNLEKERKKINDVWLPCFLESGSFRWISCNKYVSGVGYKFFKQCYSLCNNTFAF